MVASVYENKNEYIDLFYAITYCHGWVKSDTHAVTVRLEPLEQPSRRAAQKHFAKITGLECDNTCRKIFGHRSRDVALRNNQLSKKMT